MGGRGNALSLSTEAIMIRYKHTQGLNKNYSVRNKLYADNVIDEKVEIAINSLSLEELISLKLELTTKKCHGKYFGFNIWNAIRDIVNESIILYALSKCSSLNDARDFLGLKEEAWSRLLKKYSPGKYFKE